MTLELSRVLVLVGVLALARIVLPLVAWALAARSRRRRLARCGSCGELVGATFPCEECGAPRCFYCGWPGRRGGEVCRDGCP